MKTDIHPQYGETTVTCSCGNTFVTRSTAGESMHIELCNECHPFYTGTQKLVDSGGRVERFQRRYGRTSFTREEAASTAAEAPAAPIAEVAGEQAATEETAAAGAEEAASEGEEASEAET